MVIEQSKFNEKADRAYAWSAIHSEHLNISIRAVFGERDLSHHKFLEKAIDITRSLWLFYVIEMLAIFQMKTDEIVQQLIRHIHSNAPRVTRWFVGIRLKPRLHPWDEAELPMPTSNWIYFRADSPEEARVVVRCLLELAIAKPDKIEPSPNANHVFAYSSSRN